LSSTISVHEQQLAFPTRSMFIWLPQNTRLKHNPFHLRTKAVSDTEEARRRWPRSLIKTCSGPWFLFLCRDSTALLTGASPRRAPEESFSSDKHTRARVPPARASDRGAAKRALVWEWDYKRKRLSLSCSSEISALNAARLSRRSASQEHTLAVGRGWNSRGV